MVQHPQHRPALRRQYRRAVRHCRGHRGRQRGRVRRVHHPRLLLVHRAELRRHHPAGPQTRRPAAPRPALPHHPGRPLRHRDPAHRPGHLRHLEIRATPMTATEPAPSELPMIVATAAETLRPQPGLPLPPPPGDGEKYAYIDRNLPYLTITLVVSATCLIISQIRFELHDLVLLPFLAFTATYVAYQVISLPVNFAGRGFDLAAHQARTETSHPDTYPGVDRFLPSCGEPIEVLRNTWSAVFELIAGYPGLAQAHVLDDGPSDEARSVCESYGF